MTPRQEIISQICQFNNEDDFDRLAEQLSADFTVQEGG